MIVMGGCIEEHRESSLITNLVETHEQGQVTRENGSEWLKAEEMFSVIC
jgi:hypothetical protein